MCEEMRIVMAERIATELCEYYDQEGWQKQKEKLLKLPNEKLRKKYDRMYKGCEEKWEFEDSEALEAKFE